MFWARVTTVDTSTKYILTGGAQTITSHGVAIGVHGSALVVSKWNPTSYVRMIYNIAKYDDCEPNISYLKWTLWNMKNDLKVYIEIFHKLRG